MKLWIPQDRIAHHVQVVGSTGTRKSSILRRFAYQAYDRGWPVVFIDLKGEYFQEFYRPDYDYLLDFADDRCVRWMIGREAPDEPRAMPIGAGAFPDAPGRAFFFQDHARAILAYIIGTHHLSTSQLAHILAKPEEIDKLVKGTEHASTLSRNSADQRNGIIGTLNHLGRPLRWMPDDDGRREFCVREWAAMGRERRGSIFLRSSGLTFEALRPMHSLILDMILLGLQTFPGPALIIGDEIGQFQRCPQLERATSILRGSGNPIILAYQGFTQLEEHYGEKAAESIMSAPYTNIVLRTSGKRSAEYSSALLGLPAEIERFRESDSRRLFDTILHERTTWMREKAMEAAVLPGEIQSLEDGRGYMAQAGKIVKINVAYLPVVQRNEPLIPRTITPAPVEDDEAPVEKKPYKSKYTQQKLTLA